MKKLFLFVFLFKSLGALSPLYQEDFFFSQQKFLANKEKKISLYASISAVPGAGISFREKNQGRGKVWEAKAGVLKCPFLEIPQETLAASLDRSWLIFLKKETASPYLSWGIGSSLFWKEKSFNFIPYVPLRAGYELKHGFAEVGMKMLWGYTPLPEVCIGISTQF